MKVVRVMELVGPVLWIIPKLRKAEVLLSHGKSVSEACRQIDVTDNTNYRDGLIPS